MNIRFQYSAKFICGKSDGKVIAPGDYWTAINVHNPGTRRMVFQKKFVIALPNEKAGPISQPVRALLGPDEAFEIDREDIFGHSPLQAGFLKGFVVIESDMELDVVAVYTAAGATGQIETLDLERVQPRRVEAALPDLLPVPDQQGNFCRRQDGTLTVTVRNQGSAGAGPTVTRVDFGTHGAFDKPTPALLPGASVDLMFPIPVGCFDPDCEFRITVDVTGVLIESDEGNNTASGVCLG